MDLRSLTREQRMLAAAVANVLFVIMLFLPWYGGGGVSISGWSAIDSSWIILVIALVAAAILAAEALNVVQLPPFLTGAGLPAYLTSLTFWFTIFYLVGYAGTKVGIYLALIFSLIANAFTVWLWRESR
ncbi:MAG: hypothetical protein QOK40_3060 [Miltoncostaeaceae bacterium]|jgi:hypothetical protein|nr:hypothetical protein [Miltoncostaeaceae bacterium]